MVVQFISGVGGHGDVHSGHTKKPIPFKEYVDTMLEDDIRAILKKRYEKYF